MKDPFKKVDKFGVQLLVAFVLGVGVIVQLLVKLLQM